MYYESRMRLRPRTSSRRRHGRAPEAQPRDPISKELTLGGYPMKRILLAGIAALLTLSAASGAMAADKKTLVFVVNGASDFWKNAEAGVKKAQEELPNYTLQLKYPEQSAAAIQQRLMDDLVAGGV